MNDPTVELDRLNKELSERVRKGESAIEQMQVLLGRAQEALEIGRWIGREYPLDLAALLIAQRVIERGQSYCKIIDEISVEVING